jgi:hypothetical protein
MKHLNVWLILLAVLATLPCAAAQSPPPGPAVGGAPRPPISPYLNLLRRGGSVSNNYFNLVRPEFEFRNNIQRLQQDQTQLERRVDSGTQGAAGLPATGHSVQFMNTSHYFGTRSGGGATSRYNAPVLTQPVPSMAVPVGAPVIGTGVERFPSVRR